MVTGAVKSGKSTFACGLALSNYKRSRRKWHIRKFFAKLFKKEIPEEPLFYSNIPVSIPYVPVTKEVLLRKQRIRFGSVMFIDEATLVADSQLIKDDVLNESLTLFFKLYGHMSHSSLLVVNSQCIADTHYSIKRSLGAYYYVHHITKWIPFFNIIHVRECLYSDDNSTLINTVTQDAELDLRKVFVLKSVWKKFDSHAFSSLTDDLPVSDKVVVADSLKVKKIVSFRNFKTIPKEFIDNESKD